MALNLVNYDGWRLIEIRWEAKSLFPERIGVLETMSTNQTTIYRFFQKTLKAASFFRKVSEISNSMSF